MSQRDRILAALRSAGDNGLTNAELTAYSLRYGARLHELRNAGHAISCTPVKRGGKATSTMRYRLEVAS